MGFIKEFFNEFFLMFKPYFKYIRFIIVFLLFFTFSLFEKLPVIIFNLDIKMLSNNAKYTLSLFSVILALFISCLLYYKEFENEFVKFKNNIKIDFSHKVWRTFKIWLIATIIMFITNFLINYLGIEISTNDANVTKNLLISPIIYGSIILLFQPILEEITFRLAFKDIFKSKWIFVLLSGIIFGSIHVIFSLNSFSQLLYLIPYCSSGIAFSYIYYDTDNIIYPISIHIFHNVIALILTLI